VCPCSLDSKEHVLLPLWSFQGARELERPREEPPHVAGLSKLNSVTRPEGEVEVDVVPGEPVCLDGPKAIKQSRGESRATSQSRRLPE
jgi:hypothetical protein